MDISNHFCNSMNFYQAAEIFKVADQVVLESTRDFHYYSQSGLMYYEEGKYELAV